MAGAITDPPPIRSEVFQDSISQPIRDLLSSHVPNSDQSEALKCQKPNSDQWEAEFGLKRADKAVELEWAWRKSYPDNLSSSIQIDGKNVVFHPNYSSGTAAVVGDRSLTGQQHHYWELKLMFPMYGTDVMVGLATKKLDIATFSHQFVSLIGQDSNSWGYSYHGYTQHGGIKTRYGQKWKEGDFIGIHLDAWRGHLSFFHNLVPQGLAYTGLSGLELYPVVSSTAAKSEIKLVTALSFDSSLQFECYKKLLEIHHTSRQVLKRKLPPGLRKEVVNKFWFLGASLPPATKQFFEQSPITDHFIKKLSRKLQPNRGSKTKRNYKEEASSESEDDANECFLNFKSRKLALMRKSGASESLDQSEARKLSRDSCRPIRVEYSSDLESSNLIASPNSSGGFSDKGHPVVDAQESSLEDTSKPKSTSEDVQKSASDWSKQCHVTQRDAPIGQNLVSGESSPPIGQSCDKENENSSKVKEVSPKAKKRFVLKSSRKN